MTQSLDLFAAQTYVDAETYRSPGSFRATVDAQIAECARARGDGPALVVFPENVGTFLPFAFAGGASRPALAAARAALRDPRAYLRALRQVRKPVLAALAAMADEVREVYEGTFADAARREGLCVVGGSALLPGADGRVHNVSPLFDADGRLLGRTRKVNLVPKMEDTLGLAPGPSRGIEVHPSAAGRVATLICYDGFHVPHTRAEPLFTSVVERAAAADVIAHPSANPWPWDGPWVHARKDDESRDWLRREQWRLEGIETSLERLPAGARVRYAITAHLLGEVAGERFEGRSVILERGAGGVRAIATARAYAPRPESAEVIHARVPPAGARP